MGKDWDLDAGSTALDFVNTLEWRRGAELHENINSFEDLVDWSSSAGILSESEQQQLLATASQDRSRAIEVMGKALDLREVLYRIFSAYAKNREAATDDLKALNEVLAEAMARIRIKWTGEGFSWGWRGGEISFERVIWIIARAAGELLTSSQIQRVGECADEGGCAYLFIDQSRNRSRRWCSMETCGNRAKARRHYQRRRSPVT